MKSQIKSAIEIMNLDSGTGTSISQRIAEERGSSTAELLKGKFNQVTLIPWQEKVEKAYADGAKYVLIKAGRKAGKSVLSRYRLVRASMRTPTIPDQTNCYIAPEKAQAKKIMWRPLKRYVWDNGNIKELILSRPNETELFMDFKSGIRLSLEGAENEDTIRGWNIGESVIDEADAIKNGNFYSEVVEPNFLLTNPNVLFISTPKNRWFTKLWKQVNEGRLGRQWAAFHFTSFDNPYISREYLEDIKSRIPSHIWEQEYMANEYAFSGLQYPEFGAKHIVKPRNVTGPRFLRFLDWGWDHPSTCLWAELFYNTDTKRWNLYVFREFSVRGKNIEELCTAIKAGDSTEYLANIVDKSARRTEMGTGKPIQYLFAQNGVPCVLPPHKKDYHINSLKMMLQRGDIQISEDCRTLIRQLENVEWGQKEGDDAVDSLEYGAAWVYGKDFNNISMPNYKEPEPFIAPGGLLDQPSASWEVVNY